MAEEADAHTTKPPTPLTNNSFTQTTGGSSSSSRSYGGSSLHHSQQQLLLYQPLPSPPLYPHTISPPPAYHPQPRLHDGGGFRFEAGAGDCDEEASHFGFVEEQHEAEIFCDDEQRQACLADASASLLSMSSSFAIARKVEADKVISRDEWTDFATCLLLEIWGQKFVQLNRGILKMDHWVEVAEIVSKKASMMKTEMQCKHRVETLKKKYKLEKQKRSAIGGSVSKWPFYYQMDRLLNAATRRPGLPGAIDAGKMVKEYSSVKLKEMKSRGKIEVDNASTSSEDDLNFSVDSELWDGRKGHKKKKGQGDLFAVLANALTKFSETYEKMESVKQQQLSDLEKIRMEFTRDLEMHRMQLYMQTQMELARLKHCNIDIDASVSNMSDR